MDDRTLRPFAFVLAVRDFEATAKYFHDALGFEVQWAEASDWRLVSRGQVNIMIGRCPDVIPASELGDHSYFAYLQINDVDAMHAELSARGAIIRTPPTDQPYGQREMVIATPDGHRLVIGQPLPAIGTT